MTPLALAIVPALAAAGALAATLLGRGTAANRRRAAWSLCTGAVLLAAGCLGPTPDPVDLGAAEEFAVLAGEGVDNTGTTRVTGDVGSHPGTLRSGFDAGPDRVLLNGTDHRADEVARAAQADLAAAYDAAANRSNATRLPAGELGGLTLQPGVHAAGENADGLTLDGTVVLDGADARDPVFVLQAGPSLSIEAAATVELVRGADPCNVFWQVDGSARLGAGSHLVGSVLARDDVEVHREARLDGRAMARTGEVRLHASTVDAGACTDRRPACPGDVSAQATEDGRVELAWDEVPGASAYPVYRADADGTFHRIANVSAPASTYTDANATDTDADEHRYRVHALDPSGESTGCPTVSVARIPVFPTVVVLAGAGVLGLGAYLGLRARRR